MKVAHFGMFVPSGSGQFATIVDLIKAERKQGIEAELINFGAKEGEVEKPGLVYKGVETVDMKWAYEADVLVRHSVIPRELENSGKPMVMSMHGRPENSFMLEMIGRLPVYSIVNNCNLHPFYRAFVTYWKEFVPVWRLLVDPGKVFYVPAMIDMEDFSDKGRSFDFSAGGGRPNIVIADVWREDTTPYNVLHSAALAIERSMRGGRVFLFGLSTETPVLDRYVGLLIKRRIVGQAWSRVDFVDELFRGADMLVTPHVIATRVIREALACGLPIVAGGGCPYTKYSADPRNMNAFATAIERCWWDILINKEETRKRARQVAEENFSMEEAGKSMIAVLDFCMQYSKRKLKLVG